MIGSRTSHNRSVSERLTLAKETVAQIEEFLKRQRELLQFLKRQVEVDRKFEAASAELRKPVTVEIDREPIDAYDAVPIKPAPKKKVARKKAPAKSASE